MDIHNRLAVSNRVLEYAVVFVVVVSLSVVAFFALQGTLAETRDSSRIGDVAALRTALELYHTDHGSYPNIAWANSAGDSWEMLGEMLRPYIAQMPRDPINDRAAPVETTGAFNYSYHGVKTSRRIPAPDDYALVFRLEKPERAPLYQKTADRISQNAAFSELTGVEGIYAVTAP